MNFNNSLKEIPFVKKVSNFLSNDECLKVLDCHKDSYFQDHDALTNDSKSSFYYFKNREFNKFLEELNLHLNFQNRLFEHIEFSGRISNIWLNKQTKNSKLHPHRHIDCNLSGVLYIKLDKNSSGITFYYLKTHTIFPELGSLLLFPSWLTHSGSGNNLSEERIVLSFNIQQI